MQRPKGELEMQFDCSKYDGLILIGSNLRESVWVSQSQIPGMRLNRLAGRMRENATVHQLLGVALTSALRAIPDHHVKKLVNDRAEGSKPRVLVQTFDHTFGDYVTSLPNVLSNRTAERALQFQLNRFTLTFDTPGDEQKTMIFTLQKWASLNVLSADDLHDESAFMPSLVSSMSGNVQRGGDHVKF
jgi:hypothetical protein